MSILYFNRSRNIPGEEATGAVRVEIDELYARSDYIVLVRRIADCPPHPNLLTPFSHMPVRALLFQHKRVCGVGRRAARRLYMRARKCAVCVCVYRKRERGGDLPRARDKVCVLNDSIRKQQH